MSRKGFPAEVRTFDSKLAAIKWARSVEGSMDSGSHVGSAEISQWPLSKLLDRYRDEVAPTKRGGRCEAIRLNAMARKRLGDYSLANLTPERVAEFRDTRLKEVGAATVIRDLALLSGVISHARREWGLPLQNPCALVRKPANPVGRDRVLTRLEEDRLLAVLAPQAKSRLNPYVPLVVTVALETAMRRGELLAMRWEHVDLDARTVRIPLTKNGQPRVVPLSSKAIETLRTLQRPDGEVFPLTWMALDRAFRVACRRAGILNFRFHDLRHTAASRMAEKLPNLIELSAVTGHKTMQMLKRYYHPKATELALKLG